MSFDAFMTRAVVKELAELMIGARVERVLQPSKEEIFLLLHKESKHFRLQLNASPSSPRFGLTSESPENPQVPPIFCMLMRKHLTGAVLTSVTQLALERAVKLSFETYDEMGFFTERHLICEIMGRCSNIILCENAADLAEKTPFSELKIIACLRPVDFTTSSKRQLLGGMLYEPPPPQDKLNPLLVSEAEFREIAASFVSEQPQTTDLKSFFLGNFLGFSPLLAKELAFRAERKQAESLTQALEKVFFDFKNDIISEKFTPTLISNVDGEPIEFACFDVTSYEDKIISHPESFNELTDAFFAQHERIAREKSRAAETSRILSNAENRLIKKLKAQKKELADSEKGEQYRREADLIIANIYKLKRGDTEATLTDYSDYHEDGSYGEVRIKLDPRLTPSMQAQKLYKKYAKSQNAKEQLTKQLENGEQELIYIRSVIDLLSRIRGQSDLDEIRSELTDSGYIKAHAKNTKNSSGKQKNKKAPAPRPPKCFVTQSGGFTVLVGRNNIENDRLTFKTANKSDLWFHVKNFPGSHTVMLLDGAEPSEHDIEEAAIIAAQNSSVAGETKVAVDYTQIKNVKKPSGAKPGFVIYNTYRQIIVSAK